MHIGQNVVYRDLNGDYAALVTGVNPADPNIRDSVETVDLAVFKPGIQNPVHYRSVSYSTDTPHSFRNIGEERGGSTVAEESYPVPEIPTTVTPEIPEPQPVRRGW